MGSDEHRIFLRTGSLARWEAGSRSGQSLADSTFVDQPNARFEHLYVVLRVDDFSQADRVEERISLVSAFRSRDEAEGEVARLNALSRAKDCHYSVILTRLKG